MRILNSYGGCVNRIDKALDWAIQYGHVQGDRENAWVIDQVIRALTGDEYDRIMSGFNSDRARGYGSILNFVPVGLNGHAIELCPMDEDNEIRWRWAIRLGTSVEKSISLTYFSTRESALLEALDWWKTYWSQPENI